MVKRSYAKGKAAEAGNVSTGSERIPRTHTTNIRQEHKWSARVTTQSDALDLESGIFTSQSPERIARSLKQSAEHSKRRKGTVRQSATSMLNFYINRAGRNLSITKRRVLEKAKNELKVLFENSKTR